MSEDELTVVKQSIDEYLQKGWIKISRIPYGAPVIVIRKMTWELYIVIDYRMLNKQTLVDSYPIPRIIELLDRLSKAKLFTKINLASGYHQIQMAEGHEGRIAFMTRYRTFEWLVLPLSLTNAPATFQKLMNSIFYDMLDMSLLVYLDDLLAYSETEEQHLEDVREVLQRLRDTKLKAKKEKCDVNI